MMNKFTILIFVFFLSTISFGQIQEESEFKGKWIVVFKLFGLFWNHLIFQLQKSFS